jgi:hypothetical protein
MMNNNPEYSGKELEVMSFATNYHKWIVDELKPFLGDNAVEVGAGVGNLSSLLLETQLKHLHAFEPATNLFPLLSKNMQGISRVSTINEYFRPDLVPGAIDSVLYINVLEHIENDSAELVMANKSLRDGGYLLLFVPALQWLFSAADLSVGHYRRYYKNSLINLVEDAGFSIESANYFDLAGIIPWYVNFVLLKNSFNTSSVTLYDRLIVPPMRVFERLFKPPIGKNVLIVAKKN